jgi:hypothetical protein
MRNNTRKILAKRRTNLKSKGIKRKKTMKGGMFKQRTTSKIRKTATAKAAATAKAKAAATATAAAEAAAAEATEAQEAATQDYLNKRKKNIGKILTEYLNSTIKELQKDLEFKIYSINKKRNLEFNIRYILGSIKSDPVQINLEVESLENDTLKVKEKFNKLANRLIYKFREKFNSDLQTKIKKKKMGFNEQEYTKMGLKMSNYSGLYMDNEPVTEQENNTDKEIELYLFKDEEIYHENNEAKFFTLKGKDKDKDKEITFYMSINNYEKPELKTTYQITGEDTKPDFNGNEEVFSNFFPQPASPKEVRHSSTATPSTSPVNSMTGNTRGELSRTPSATVEDLGSLEGFQGENGENIPNGKKIPNEENV